MPITVVEEILNEVRATFLNDRNATEATDDILLSHFKTAYHDLETTLLENGVQIKNEEVEAIISAGVSEYFPLPADFVIPVTMFERQPNTSDSFREMSYKANLPELPASAFLTYWTYRVDRIFVCPANSDREIKLYYRRSFPVAETIDAAVFGHAESFLSARTAAYYLIFVRQNQTLAAVANDIAEKELASAINIQVKIGQSEPIRRKGYRPFFIR